MKVRKIGIKGKALNIFNDGRVLIYRKGSLYIYTCKYEKIARIDLPITKWKKIFGQIRVFERLLHIEPRFAIEIDDNCILLQLGHSMLRIDIDKKTIVEEHVDFRGRPLGYAKLKNIEGFDDSVVIGDYGANYDNKEVNIYQRESSTGRWRISYTFAPGTMWHIHGFVPNTEEGCVYILTGDEDDQSGIWRATDNFKNVVPIVIGSQQFRTCQMSYDSHKFYFFTDAPSEPNYLYSYENETGLVSKLEPINGTCIYGCNVPDGIIASTTCEPDAHFESILYGMITTKPGKGVRGRMVDLLYYRNNGKLETIKTFKHDGLPLKLFQYGTVVFSNYNCGKVLCTPISVVKEDMNIYEVTV